MAFATLVVTSVNDADVGGDPYDAYSGEDNPYLPPVFMGDNFVITVGAELTLEEGDEIYQWSISSVTSSSLPYYEYTNTGTSVELRTGSTSPFSDYFEFLMPDNTLQQISIESAREQGFLALIQWSPPSSPVTTVSHTFTVNYTNTTTQQTFSESINKSHNLYFQYQPYTQLIKDLAAEGAF